MTYLLRKPLIDPISANYFADKVFRTVRTSNPLAIRRKGFWTLGAATYQDDPEKYADLARMLNPLMLAGFKPLIEGVCEEVLELIARHQDPVRLTRREARVLGLPPPAVSPWTFLPDKGLPGFHYFDCESNGREGSIHIDEPYERCEWPMEFSDPWSFTLVLSLPHCGGGINIWPEDTKEEDVLTTGPTFSPYGVGELIVHTGKRIHQIANPSVMFLGEHRITMQGHSVKLSDGRVVFYF